MSRRQTVQLDRSLPITCNFRHYKSLRQGYNLLRSEKFTTFRAQANVVASPVGPSTSTAAPSEKRFLLVECVPVYSAFQGKIIICLSVYPVSCQNFGLTAIILQPPVSCIFRLHIDLK